MPDLKYRSSGIGGQAVLEGIMMRNKDRYSVAVRKPDQEIEVCVKPCGSITEKHRFFRLPLIRGVFSFVDSLILGMKTLTYSADFFLEETPEEKEKAEKKKKKKEAKKPDAKKEETIIAGEEKQDDSWIMIPTVIFSIVIAVALFMILPLFLSELCVKYIPFMSNAYVPVIEGIVKMILFLSYLLLISRMKDIQRTFMYHGAEHKCINCIETGHDLTVENVRNSSRFHKRCGTSFLLFVMIVSIVLFMFMNFDNRLVRYVVRIACIPLIAGISYEFIRLAGRSENKWINLLSKPGLAMQRITTSEPTDDMIEVAIAAVEAVFDWKAYLYGESDADL